MDAPERIAQNEATFRRVNEALEPEAAPPDARARFVCECARLGCTDTIELEVREYEAVRTSFDRFLLVAGHESHVDEVLEEHDDRYLVVAKQGAARDVAAHEDPRAGEEDPRAGEGAS